MSADTILTKLYKRSPRTIVSPSEKIVLLSDCHRGDGSNADNYIKNQIIAFYALQCYDREGFCVIELGDGDELWENRRFEEISSVHGNTLQILNKLYRENRFYMLYGNHDMCKSKKKWVKKYMQSYERKNCEAALFSGIEVHEGLVLQYPDQQVEIFLLHGHQVDVLNYQLWILARFLVRYVWRPLEMIGLNNPGSAKNHNNLKKIEKKLINWVEKTKIPIIAGHTHRSQFPTLAEEALYFNDGCCVHPRCITAIEIQNGKLKLVKWSVETNRQGTLAVTKSLLEGPLPLEKLKI